MRTIGIFYFSRHQQDDTDRTPITLNGRTLGYVRSEIVHADNLIDALDRAVLRKGEAVMNTHYLDEV